LDAGEDQLSGTSDWSVINGGDIEGLGGWSGAAIAIGDDKVDGSGAVEVGLRCVGVGVGISVVGDLPVGSTDPCNGEGIVISVREAV